MSNLEKQKEFFPYLTDKAIVDFVNGLSVVQDHNGIMKERSDLEWRILDSISGKNHKRQTAINENIQNGLNAALMWLKSVNDSVVEHAYAINRIKNILSKQSAVVDQLIDHTLEIRESIFHINQQISNLDERLIHLDNKVNAKDQLDKLVVAWKSNDVSFQSLSLIEKIYYLLESLAYGPFNMFLIKLKERRSFKEIEAELKHVKNCLIECIKQDLQYEALQPESPIARRIWIKKNVNMIDPKKQEVLEYLGIRSLRNISQFPITYLATQWDSLNEEEKQRANVNYIISPNNLIDYLQKEVGLVGDTE